MAKLAHKSLKIWKELERDAGTALRSMTGLLNFGNPKMGEGTPEGEQHSKYYILASAVRRLMTIAGTLTGPIDNLEALKMPYRKSMTDITGPNRSPFKSL